MKIVLVTGGFDPIHSGHIAYFKAARALGDMLIVGLNSDDWLERKKGRAFMPWNERLCIVNNLAMVDEVYTFDDDDGTALHFIQQVRAHYPDSDLIFANGGDRTAENTPEMPVNDSNIEFVFGVGGDDKKNSSSSILKQWRSYEVQRSWGSYTVLNEIPGAKVKTLTVMPGQTLSMQRHQHRSEYWMVTSGMCMINMALPGDMSKPPKILEKYDEWRVPAYAWHQLTNPFTKPCTIVEIQYGKKCDEEDIERLDWANR